MTRLIVMLLLLACSGERAPRPTQIIDTLPPVAEPEPPHLAMRAMAAPVPGTKVDTTRRVDTTVIAADSSRWQDTTKLADTAIAYSRGRAAYSDVRLRTVQVVRTVRTAVTVDSAWQIKIGIPFGAFSVWDGNTLKPNADLFTLSLNNVSPALLPGRLAQASRKRRLLLALAGGSRETVKTNGVFDRAKYDSVLRSFTPLVPQIMAATQTGAVLGALVMDEPFNRGGPGNEANGWGGVMTKARVDSLCQDTKQLVPGIVTGVTHDWDDFEPTKSYRTCDFMLSQYRYAKGDIRAFRDSSLAIGKRDKHAVAFSLNILDGGIPAPGGRTGPWLCDPNTTGGRGTYSPNCRMTPQQIVGFGLVLLKAGCAGLFWRHEESMLGKPEYRAAVKLLADSLAVSPVTPCRRA